MGKEFIAHYIEADKREQTVREHLEEVAHLTGFFANKVGLPVSGQIAGLLHDLGKYSQDFQMYIRSAEGKLDPDQEPVDTVAMKGKIDHSSAGAQMVWKALKDNNPKSRLSAQLVALCIASHHSGLIDCLSPDGEDRFSTRMEKNPAETHLVEVQKTADAEILDKADALLKSPRLVEELMQQLNLLFSNEDSGLIREFYLGMVARFLFSTLIDADRLNSAGRHNGASPQWNILIERLEQHLSGLKQKTRIDTIRAEVSLACRSFATREKGLYRLTVPTGGGKTLSSLRFGLHHAACHHMDRLIYVIPYTSIIDQNADVARMILEQQVDGEEALFVLEHHSNLTRDKETAQNRLLSENWDAPVIFTTTVQFMEALFAGGTRGARRMHRLANAVIIFDEVQTIPIKTVHLFNNAINFLVKGCGSSVVLCTATQPLLDGVDPIKGAAKLSDRPEMAPRPNVISQDLKRVNVHDLRKNGGWTEDEIAHYICDKARESGSTLAIVNTKSAALALFNLCRKDVKVTYHLSTNMCPAHRIEVLKEIKNKLDLDNYASKPLVCISTQLVEAGVDVDFGTVVRYLAGLDSIAQAAGRCNRNGKRATGEVIVINPSSEALSMLPEIKVGREIAERVLDEFRTNPKAFDNDLLSPKSIALYFKYYFFDRAHEMSYPLSANDIGHNDNILSLLSTNNVSVEAYKRSFKSSPVLNLRQSFRSAGETFKVIDAPTEGIVVPYGSKGKEIISQLCSASDLEQTSSLLRKAQRYVVNTFPQFLDKLADRGCIHETSKGTGIFYLDERYYSKEVGVTLYELVTMDFLNA